MRKKIHVFDFDGTLTTRDTLLLFIRFVKGGWALWLGMLLYAPLLVLMKLRLLDNGRVKERVFSHFFRGTRESTFDYWCELFADYYSEILRPQGIATIRKALADGDEVCIVSASIDNWVRPFFVNDEEKHWDEEIVIPKVDASRLNIICTEAEVKNGRLTGRFSTPNCYGKEKVRRLRQAVPNLDDYDEIIVYGDSRGDEALFEIATERHYKPFRGDV